MAKHNLKCTSEAFALAFCEIDHHFETAHMPDVQIGDLIKMVAVEGEGEEEKALGQHMMREVAQVRHEYQEGWVTKLTLVPLDHPPMQQVQITNPSLGTFVCWIGSHERFEVGSSIRLLGDLTWWTVQFVCTKLHVRDLPKDARVGFLSEVQV